MKILRFEAEKLHGYISFALEFHSNLTLLTGINGSGKTSAVRAIASLLVPSLFSLVDMEYERISVTVDNGFGPVSIACRRLDQQLILSCSLAKEHLVIPILTKERFETPTRYVTRRREFYSEQEAINAKNDSLAAIDGLPTPMYLDIDRRNVSSMIERRESQATAYRPRPFVGTTNESLRLAENLAERAYSGFMAERSKQTDILKQEIVLAAFRPSEFTHLEPFVPAPAEKKDYLRRVHRNESVLPVALAQIGVSPERINDLVRPFFGKARQILDQVPLLKELTGKLDDETFKAVQEWSRIQPQLRQVDQLVELIEKYNQELNTLYLPFRSYLESVNAFLSESQKRLFFAPNGDLSVQVSEDGAARPISALSSGERQLVVILTHLAFNKRAKLANVLIIDEPELSLHIRWQELFVEAIMAASPDIQLILATHSPAIIGNRLENCIDVLEARNIDSLFA